MPEADAVLRFGVVVEGHGENHAVPALVRRVCSEVCGRFDVVVLRPIRVTKSKLVRPGELERAILLAKNLGADVFLVVLDADRDCPAELGPALKARALSLLPRGKASIVIATIEFEAWFLAAIESLRGKRGLRLDLSAPDDPEGVPGAKEWLTKGMKRRNQRYSPTIDQAALANAMDIQAARRCRSFDRFCREIERLLR